MPFRLNSYLKSDPIPRLRQIILFLLAGLFAEAGFGQSRTITGTVLDSVSHAPLTYVTVSVRHSRSGVVTNIEGKFSIRVDRNAAQLAFVAAGYKPVYIPVEEMPDSPVTVVMPPAYTILKDFVIKAKPGRYRNKNNPAVELIRRVIENKGRNGPNAPAYTSYQQYEKIRLLLDKVPRLIADDKVLKKYHFLFENHDTTLMPGKSLVPVYIEEVLSDNYYRKHPEKARKIVVGRKAVDFGEYIDMKGISQFINRLYENINIYDNTIDLFTTQFTSPIADVAPTFYMFFIRDTTVEEGQRIVRLYFTPRNPEDLLFRGHLYINLDNNYAVTRVELGVSQHINLNFVREFQVKQDFEQGDDGHYHVLNSDMIALFNAIPGTFGMVGERIVKLDQVRDSTLPNEIFKGPEVDTVMDARGTQDSLFTSRPIPLTASEERTYANVDSLTKMRSYHRLLDYATAFTAGYKSAGKVDIGPIGNFWTFNQIEGQRLRFGGRTNTRLSKRYYAESYVAYGFKDQRWKYFASASYAFNNKSIYTYPLHYVQVSWLDDTRSLGAENAFSGANNFFSSFTRGDNSKWLYNHIGRLSYIHEYSNHLSYNLGMKYWQQRPTGSLFYVYEPAIDQFDSVRRIVTGELSLTLRWAPHEEFFQNKAGRTDVINRWPIVTLQYAKGIRGLFGGQYNYDAFRFDLYKRVYISPIGFSDVTLDAGYVGNNLPFPLLTIAPGNQSYFYYENIYNLMNIGEFVSDHYASLDIDHFFNGFFFNKVPGLKRLKLREVIAAKFLWGGLRDANNPVVNTGQMKFPTTNGLTTTYPLGDKPYIEASVGIYNILSVVRLDLVKRFTYLDHPNISTLGLRVSTSFNF
ncbi:MAG TPA: DUF5686 family protein [Puia sp.]|nr:DUF5686 family protein [Puia sp.]